MIPEQKAFCDAVQTAARVFSMPKHKKKLKDLSPRFWVALMDLELSCGQDDWGQLKIDFRAAYRYLGAPGDFGYGTPCGDSLRGVYDKWSLLCKAKEPAVSPPNQVS